MDSHKRILILAPDLPFPPRGGGQMRMASIVKSLASMAKIHCACLSPGLPHTTSEWMEQLGASISSFPRRREGFTSNRITALLRGHNLKWYADEQAFFDGELNSFNPDLIWLETPYLIRYALHWRHSLPKVMDFWGTSQGAGREYNHARGLARIPKFVSWVLASRGEKLFAPEIKNIVTVSNLDADYFNKIAPRSRTWPVPIGIDITDPPTYDITENPNLMIMTGDMSFRPNIDAAVCFTKSIFPLILMERPKTQFMIAGRNPSSEIKKLASHSKITVTGEVANLQKLIAKAAIYILPMRLGSGIRTKLLEAFLTEKPVVTTSIGAEGLDLVSGTSCLVADSSEKFSLSCCKLLGNPDLRKRIGKAAREMVISKYSQEQITLKLTALLDSLPTKTSN